MPEDSIGEISITLRVPLQEKWRADVFQKAMELNDALGSVDDKLREILKYLDESAVAKHEPSRRIVEDCREIIFDAKVDVP